VPGIPKITLHTIAGAPLGDSAFARFFNEDRRLKAIVKWRTINDADAIPQMRSAMAVGFRYVQPPVCLFRMLSFYVQPAVKVFSACSASFACSD
jgi:hypothetical protein